jgi:FkbM family methyltransferase
MRNLKNLVSNLGRLAHSGNNIPDKALEEIFNRANLKLVDIGARGGSQTPLRLLAPYSQYYACEPNHEEALVLQEKIRSDAPWRGITIIPDALSKNEGTATLNVTKQPGASSLLMPDYTVINKFHTAGYFDIESTSAVTTISLDHAANQYNFKDACFLKLDTQGTELDILESGNKLVSESLLGIYVEISFRQFYKEQPLFSDIDSFLRNKNFSLFDLAVKFKRRAHAIPSIAAKGQPVWGNALYMKEPEAATNDNTNENALLKISQLLAISLAYEQYDFALELTRNGRTGLLFSEAFGDKVYENLLNFILHRRPG